MAFRQPVPYRVRNSLRNNRAALTVEALLDGLRHVIDSVHVQFCEDVLQPYRLGSQCQQVSVPSDFDNSAREAVRCGLRDGTAEYPAPGEVIFV